MKEDLKELGKRHEDLMARYAIASRRADVSASKAADILRDELQLRLRQIRAAYIDIDTTTHPTTVIARLSALQGQEMDARDQLRMWATAEDVKKGLAKEIELCEEGIRVETERERYDGTR
jgi:hypothetical protein